MKDLALANVVNTFLMHLIPNAQLEIIDDGYLFLVTRPDETAGIIETFCRAVPKSHRRMGNA